MPRIASETDQPVKKKRLYAKHNQIKRVMVTNTYADSHTYGRPISISPHSALLEEIHRTAGHVAWLGQVVSELTKEEIVHGQEKEVEVRKMVGGGEGEDDDEPGITTEVRSEVSAGANVWVKLYQVEREQLRRVCETAIRAGIEERYVQLEESRAQVVAEVIKTIVLQLGHSLQDEDVRNVVRNNLMMLATGQVKAVTE